MLEFSVNFDYQLINICKLVSWFSERDRVESEYLRNIYILDVGLKTRGNDLEIWTNV